MELKMQDLEFDVKPSYKDYIANYIAKHCLVQADPTFFGKIPGTRYQSQFYMARALYNKEFMSFAADEFYKIIKENVGDFDFQLAGRDWSSIPILSAFPILLEKYNVHLNSFLIRSNIKTYGLHNYIEGIPNDKPVLIVDDVCNSSNSFQHCHKVLEFENLPTLPFIFAIVNKYRKDTYQNAMMEDRYLRNNIKPLSIVTGDDIDHAFGRTKIGIQN